MVKRAIFFVASMKQHCCLWVSPKFLGIVNSTLHAQTTPESTEQKNNYVKWLGQKVPTEGSSKLFTYVTAGNIFQEHYRQEKGK